MPELDFNGRASVQHRLDAGSLMPAGIGTFVATQLILTDNSGSLQLRALKVGEHPVIAAEFVVQCSFNPTPFCSFSCRLSSFSIPSRAQTF
jgi:hypothetical protein